MNNGAGLPDVKQSPATDDDFSRKLLEGALEQQASATNAFFRDLKVVLVAALLLQFLVLPQQLTLAQQQLWLQDLQSQRDDIERAKLELDKTSADLRAGTTTIETELSNAAPLIRPKIIAMSCYLESINTQERARNGGNTCDPSAGGEPPPISVEQMSAGLTDADLQVLQETDISVDQSNIDYRAVVHKVLINVLKPAFDDLAAKKQAALDAPFARHRETLMTLFAERLSSYLLQGIDTTEIATDLAAIQEDLDGLKIEMPSDDQLELFLDYQEKEGYFKALRDNVDLVIEQLQTELAPPGTQLVEAQDRLDATLAQVRLNVDELNARVKAQTDDLKDSLGPLGAIGVLTPLDTARYFPVVLLVIAAYFGVRYWLLLRRTRNLAMLCRELGGSASAVEARFTDLPGTSIAAKGTAGLLWPAWGSFAVPWLIVGGLATWWASKVATTDDPPLATPWIAYAIGATLFVAACALATSSLLDDGMRSSGTSRPRTA